MKRFSASGLLIPCAGFVPLVLVILWYTSPVYAWSEHTIMTYRVFYDQLETADLEPVQATTLQAFLVQEQAGLEKILESQEQWSRDNLPNYAPRPDDLAFKAKGRSDDIVERFLHAIRLNPDSRMKLFIELLPGESPGSGPVISPGSLTTLNNNEFIENTVFVELTDGQEVSWLRVLASASNEPDYGFDLGLFEDNNTPFGARYGFGDQPFGNPNLEYSSQAPFHMGFYHEPRIVFMAGPFLRQTYPEYRIHLFKTLAEYAFRSGQNYWGWRFMGWGMHYLGDLSMPYHASPLPGVSAQRMILTNIKAILGFPESRDHAVQLVSNRHTVMEKFQADILKKAWEDNDFDHAFIQALDNPIERLSYTDDFARNVAAGEAAGKADRIDRALETYMPRKLVSDPTFEVSGTKELSSVLLLIEKEHGKEGIEQMTLVIADLLRSYSMHLRSYMHSILESPYLASRFLTERMPPVSASSLNTL